MELCWIGIQYVLAQEADGNTPLHLAGEWKNFLWCCWRPGVHTMLLTLKVEQHLSMLWIVATICRSICLLPRIDPSSNSRCILKPMRALHNYNCTMPTRLCNKFFLLTDRNENSVLHLPAPRRIVKMAWISVLLVSAGIKPGLQLNARFWTFLLIPFQPGYFCLKNRIQMWVGWLLHARTYSPQKKTHCVSCIIHHYGAHLN